MPQQEIQQWNWRTIQAEGRNGCRTEASGGENTSRIFSQCLEEGSYGVGSSGEMRDTFLEDGLLRSPFLLYYHVSTRHELTLHNYPRQTTDRMIIKGLANIFLEETPKSWGRIGSKVTFLSKASWCLVHYADKHMTRKRYLRLFPILFSYSVSWS